MHYRCDVVTSGVTACVHLGCCCFSGGLGSFFLSYCQSQCCAADDWNHSAGTTEDFWSVLFSYWMSSLSQVTLWLCSMGMSPAAYSESWQQLGWCRCNTKFLYGVGRHGSVRKSLPRLQQPLSFSVSGFALPKLVLFCMKCFTGIKGGDGQNWGWEGRTSVSPKLSGCLFLNTSGWAKLYMTIWTWPSIKTQNS